MGSGVNDSKYADERLRYLTLLCSDIGVSAQTQLDVLEARRTARSSLTGSSLLLEESAQGSGAGSSVQRSAQARQDQEQLDAEHGDHMTEFNAAEEAATLPATVFPRSMLQLQLSDGFTTVVGFEHRRVPGLSMADTPLGAKVLLRDVRYNKGKLFLDPRGVIVKGGQVAALELDAEEKLMDHLREKLGKPPLERRSGRASGNARTQSAANGSTTRPTDNTAAPAPRAATSISAGPSSSRRAQPQEQEQGPPSSFDEAQFEEDEAMWAELQEEQEAMRKASVAAPRAPVRPASTTLRPAVAGASSISRRVERVAPEDKVDDAPLPPSPSPSSSPPQRPSNRKKFKPLQPSSSVSPPPRAGKRPRPQLGRGMVDEEEDLEEEGKEHFSRSARDVPRDGYEDAVGASFFAEGMDRRKGQGRGRGRWAGRLYDPGEERSRESDCPERLGVAVAAVVALPDEGWLGSDDWSRTLL
ncbi:hypothetical protein BCV69DRAFT_282432 [Microstroma glucosiphilum]|uniref:RecQ-mediated genome instability protein 1 n=1 Tax=Pseudomicrostroma glucosiphilum TaxID=1684307 RepID=A0A316U6S1_9BASI|nr:hypothetical protein BCV69DRAFT_282432 [Pseudomicrostroma glucosiphilum]PWN20920.1 hypothetical protein BCV69DRAFT_282432 [Pseudomicrostroma glucosiphilum]